tara:strand:+ start:546 stop:764 length:219 start_codon:yes stop_codon:yes gene_type:complete
MINFIKDNLNNHPKSVCMSYFEHLKLAFGFSFYFFKKSIQSLIHGFYPNLYITSTTDCIEEIKIKLKDKGCR